MGEKVPQRMPDLPRVCILSPEGGRELQRYRSLLDDKVMSTVAGAERFRSSAKICKPSADVEMFVRLPLARYPEESGEC